MQNSNGFLNFEDRATRYANLPQSHICTCMYIYTCMHFNVDLTLIVYTHFTHACICVSWLQLIEHL